MKIVFTGKESSGKSLMLASYALRLLKRNVLWYKKYGWLRPLYSNLLFSQAVSDKYKGFIHYWSDIREIIGKTGIDVIHDEISTDFSALKREPLPRSINQWLR